MKRMWIVIPIVLLLFLATQVASVNAQLLCKQFQCTATAMPKDHGAEVRLQFTLTPHLCATQCTCDKIVYIQVARAKNLGGDGNWIFPDEASVPPDKTLSQDINFGGWFLDGQTNCGDGYYGAEGAEPGKDCPTSLTFEREIITVGHASGATDPRPAELFDRPLGHANEHLEFIDVPICISGTCNNSILGFYSWWFIDDKTNDSEPFVGPFHRLGLAIHPKVVNRVITHWNDKATKYNLKPFPPFTQFP
jgi:hypothetical protein